MMTFENNKLILLDTSYVSNLLRNSIISLDIPIYIFNSNIEEKWESNMNIIDDITLAHILQKNSVKIYMNLENPLNTLSKAIPNSRLVKSIDMFREKNKFRELIKDRFREFFFTEKDTLNICEVNVTKFPFPLIIKPSYGFFSEGVYLISKISEWHSISQEYAEKMREIEKEPSRTINTKKVLIEEYISGKEYAVDAFFNSNGKPIILNIFLHLFGSNGDLRDVVYYTNKKVIQKMYKPIRELLLFIHNQFKSQNLILENFPLHLEVRLTSKGEIIPIEVNPMRFAGWCTTDLAKRAYGINTYEYFFKDKEPDWESILDQNEDLTYCFVIGHLPPDINKDEISIDWNNYNKQFNEEAEIRKIKYKKINDCGIFAIVFDTVKNVSCLNKYLTMDSVQFLESKH